MIVDFEYEPTLDNHMKTSEGWTIIKIPQDRNYHESHKWCMDNIDVGDWTCSIGMSTVNFWFRHEKDATMYTLMWV